MLISDSLTYMFFKSQETYISAMAWEEVAQGMVRSQSACVPQCLFLLNGKD